MLKKFMMKKVLQSQVKHLPKDQQEAVLSALEKDPQLFENIAKEMKAEMKKGKNQMAAAMTVMPKYQTRLQELMGGGMQKGGGTAFNPDGSLRR